MASMYALTPFRNKTIRFLVQWIKTIQSYHSTFPYWCAEHNEITYSYNNRKLLFHHEHIWSTQLNIFRYSSKIILHCWNCGEKDEKGLFCEKCNVIQQPDRKRNYFDLLGVEQNYDVHPTELTTRYRKLQNVLHPDRFSNKRPEELKISEEYSSLVNKAYFTLLQPLSRGIYMLELRGVFIEKGTSVSSPEFLMEIMERNQEVVESNAVQLKELTSQNQASLIKLDKEVSEAFNVGNTKLAEELLVKMKYYASISATIKDLKQRRDIED